MSWPWRRSASRREGKRDDSDRRDPSSPRSRWSGIDAGPNTDAGDAIATTDRSRRIVGSVSCVGGCSFRRDPRRRGEDTTGVPLLQVVRASQSHEGAGGDPEDARDAAGGGTRYLILASSRSARHRNRDEQPRRSIGGQSRPSLPQSQLRCMELQRRANTCRASHSIPPSAQWTALPVHLCSHGHTED